MLMLLQEAANQGPDWLLIARTAAQAAQGIVTALGILIGGIFAYYKFFRQGEHDSRLQPSVASEVILEGGVAYIIATVNVLNAGQVDVTLNLQESGLLIEGREAGGAWREPQRIYGVFPGQQKGDSGETLVQPSETLEDQIWIEYEYGRDVAICLELTIAEKAGLTWRTVEVVSLLDGGKKPSDG